MPRNQRSFSAVKGYLPMTSTYLLRQKRPLPMDLQQLDSAPPRESIYFTDMVLFFILFIWLTIVLARVDFSLLIFFDPCAAFLYPAFTVANFITMDGAPSTTDMYPAICAWTDPHTLFMDVSSMSDQYQQPSGLSYGYVPIPSIAWPSIPGVEYSYSTASLAQAEAFPEIGAPSQPFSSSFLCPSRQIASVNPRNPKKSRPKFTDDDKREICQYHEFNKQAKHQEIAGKINSVFNFLGHSLMIRIRFFPLRAKVTL